MDCDEIAFGWPLRLRLDGILQQVSLRESDSDGPLDSTLDPSSTGCKVPFVINISSPFFIDVPNALKHNAVGGVFAVAEVWPSRKVLILHLHENTP